MLRFLMVLLAMAAVTPALADEMRSISGKAAYRERVILPKDAELVVEVTGFQDAELGLTTEPTDGKQVPVDFSVDIPDKMQGLLRVAFTVEGQVRWISDPVHIAAGSGALDLGTVMLHGYVDTGYSDLLICGDETMRIGFNQDGAVLERNGVAEELAPTVVVSGVRYQSLDGKTIFSGNGKSGTLTLEGRDPADCTLKPIARKVWSAQGNEPGWMARIDDQRLTLDLNYGADRLDLDLPEPEIESGAYHYGFPQLGLDFAVSDGICRDDMSGRIYPQTITLKTLTETLKGCGGNTLSLLSGKAWTVEEIGGHALAVDNPPTLTVMDDGTVSGFAGCNQFSGAFVIDGEGAVKIGPLAVTEKMCAAGTMSQEKAFLDTLVAVTAFDISSNGKLKLMTGDTVAVLAGR
ncbi:META domain-containing protein [Martelella sp. HB161492]|uniref:META domain-containing protein n=1 Tax=Martelella sp. HB161492 TaxID=2720726 RepID=UPI0015912DDA|nr:META domain-containing protein [Martelella sp. HB161492]